MHCHQRNKKFSRNKCFSPVAQEKLSEDQVHDSSTEKSIPAREQILVAHSLQKKEQCLKSFQLLKFFLSIDDCWQH